MAMASEIPVGATEHGVRRDVRRWLADAWDPDLALTEWRSRLTAEGWSTPSWPTRWHGRDLPSWADEVVRSELAEVGAVGPPVGAGMILAAPTILKHGPDPVRHDYLYRTIVGTATWCQLFSEPGAGSDLAGLTTSAELHGDEWIVNGQKLWSTSAHHADYGMLLARTRWDLPKHGGLTFLVIPMDQPGVEVRPIRQMNGYSSFNEVFLTEARVPARAVVGAPGEGWKVAMTTLAYERRLAALTRPRYASDPRLALDQARAEAEHYFATYSWYPQRAGQVDMLVESARRADRHGDASVRQAVVRALSVQRVNEWNARRAQQALSLGRRPGPEGSIGKLAASRLAQMGAEAHTLIAGASAMVVGPDAPFGPLAAEVALAVPAQSIAGGTDEIQRNILAEKVLGLPRDQHGDRTTPFRDVPRSP